MSPRSPCWAAAASRPPDAYEANESPSRSGESYGSTAWLAECLVRTGDEVDVEVVEEGPATAPDMLGRSNGVF